MSKRYLRTNIVKTKSGPQLELAFNPEKRTAPFEIRTSSSTASLLSANRSRQQLQTQLKDFESGSPSARARIPKAKRPIGHGADSSNPKAVLQGVQDHAEEVRRKYRKHSETNDYAHSHVDREEETATLNCGIVPLLWHTPACSGMS